MSFKEQSQIYRYPSRGTRRVIVSTDIAESSITIDNVTYVIDSGFIRVPVYEILEANRKRIDMIREIRSILLSPSQNQEYVLSWVVDEYSCLRNKEQEEPAEFEEVWKYGPCREDGVGRCYRLFTESSYRSFRSEPFYEITRINLANVIPLLKYIHIDNVYE